MCVAIMGRVAELDEKNAVVDYHGAKIKARRDLVDVNIGDKVLVHAGCIIQKVSDEDSRLMDEMNELMREMNM